MSKSDYQAIDHTASIRHKLLEGETSSLKRYALLVIGEVSIWKLLKYELIVFLFGSLQGALGLGLRQIFYPKLFKKVGRGVVFGRNLVIRNARNVVIGDNVMIDDQVLIDARGVGDDGIVIGDNVIINREAVLISKVGGIHIGSDTDVGMRAFLISTGGIIIGSKVGLAGECKLGGSMSQLEHENVGGEEQEPDENWQVYKYSTGAISDQIEFFAQSRIRPA